MQEECVGDFFLQYIMEYFNNVNGTCQKFGFSLSGVFEYEAEGVQELIDCGPRAHPVLLRAQDH